MTNISPHGQFCWTRESQWTKIDTWLWNGMMELVDMPGMSPVLRICRLGTSNPKQIAGFFRGPFCVSTLRVLNFWVGEHFCTWGGPLKKKGPQLVTRIFCAQFQLLKLHRMFLVTGSRCKLIKKVWKNGLWGGFWFSGGIRWDKIEKLRCSRYLTENYH